MTPRKQVGVLAWRVGATGGVEVMLITSRNTGRWVAPKGNRMAGLADHAAAAQEAWEEAGLRGVTAPTPLGHYRYGKRRRLGGVRPCRVALYPMRVTGQEHDWPERHQRVTQWFDLSAAAAAVAEPELQNLIAGFRKPQRLTYVDRSLPVRSDSRSFRSMLGWFQSLLPKGGQFFEQFEGHAATLTAGADALARLLTGDGEAARHRAEIARQEHLADDITRDVLQDVRRIFVTPFDRSAITDLIGVMDDAIDQMNTFATATELYEIRSFAPQMQAMGGVIVEAARVTAQAVPLLRSIGSNGGRINELTARIIELEGDADRMHVDGMKALFKSVDPSDAMRFVIERELYNSLERIVDRIEDVANEIQGLVIDHA